nr:PIN domain-containing protein [Wielerella bovis]
MSAITRAEVLVGFDEAEKLSVIPILNGFELLNIDKNIADMTAQFRQKYRTKLPDALQASVAIYHNLILVSRNSKDFKENQSYLGRENLVLCPYVL